MAARLRQTGEAQRVPLLHPCGGKQAATPKLESTRLLVAPSGKASQGGEVGASLLQHYPPTNTIENIGDVEFDQDFVGGVFVATHPRPDGVDGFLSTARDGHSNLGWPEEGPCILAILLIININLN